ncbi:MAG: PLP-dependent aminotransferase family protein, partial [Oscillochloris sp.]|nr:PLP-dependent aminotransferase family protein [Oscillochloris sp.]
PPSALKALDRNGHVIYLSSFSKSLMPGLRMGYTVARPDLISRLVYRRQAQDICSPPLTQRALAVFIEHGWWHNHIKRMLPRYRERRDALLQAMERLFPATADWTHPQGGFACWVTLPHDVVITDLYLSAIKRGVAFAPGAAFSAAPGGQPHLRLCFGTESPERLTEAVAILGGLLRERSSEHSLPTPSLADYVPMV